MDKDVPKKRPRICQPERWVDEMNKMKVQIPRSEKELYSIVREWRSKNSNTGRTFFRGQSNRYFSPDRKDWILPSICRANNRWILQDELNQHIETLNGKVRQMAERYLDAPVWSDDVSIKRLLCDKNVSHGLCQHYQLCRTPHLDVSEDFEVAYSFAKHKNLKKGFVFLICTPRCPHLVNVFFEENLYAINLQKITIPQSTRPNVQKAWSLSFYPEISSLTKELYGPASFNLVKYADFVIDLGNILRKPKFTYDALMVEDEFYKVIIQQRSERDLENSRSHSV